MEQVLERISHKLKELDRTWRIKVTAATRSNGHHNSHVKLCGEVGSWHHRQLAEMTVKNLLPDSIKLLSEIKVRESKAS